MAGTRVTRTDTIDRCIPGAVLVAAGLAVGLTPAALAQGPLSEPFPATLELADLDGEIGFTLNGIAAGDASGVSVASAGDVNGDGISDILIGAFEADPGGRSRAGEAYVVFGRDAASGGAFPPAFELADLDGTDGFRLHGAAPGDFSGISISPAGDVNGDRIDDIVIGARFAGSAGASYVVFGRDTATTGSFPPAVELADLDGTDGFRINGIDATDSSGACVASAGDANGDGIGDILIAAPLADPGGRGQAGETYVVFGRDTATVGPFPAVFDFGRLGRG